MDLSIDQIKERTWDNIVIGTGIGSAVLGHALAKSGQSVLFCEKGLSRLNTGRFPEESISRITEPSALNAIFKQSGRSTDALNDRSRFISKRLFPLLGSGAGGSSALYGMAFERFFPCDFTPGRYKESSSHSTAPDRWPITYDDLVPYYEKAESLFKVRGAADPLKPADRFQYREPRAPHPINLQLMDELKKQGLHPYLLPKAYDDVPGCETCQGILCAKNCKNDAFKICLQPAISEFNAALLLDCEVVKLEANDAEVTRAVVSIRGEIFTLKAKRFILGAGAIHTPQLLLKSKSAIWPRGLANSSGVVGKNLMRHLIDVYSLSFPNTDGSTKPLKEIAFNDFYYRNGVKLGTVQSFGAFPPAQAIVQDLARKLELNSRALSAFIVRKLNSPIARQVSKLTDSSTVLAATLEDFPYIDNQVSLHTTGELELRYKLRSADRKRLRILRKEVATLLAPYRPRRLSFAHNNELLGHVCGTCRFGDDPTTSVLNRYNQTHDLKNLYIVDASFFPTSGGTNPGLTIAANALRVADHMLSDTSGAGS
ncbi:MAG: GMC family oxidoreductase [Bdellovibrionales bacterium]|nr:GMC family oxidoreductase [Bdellovibrionales bacterium]